MQFSHDTIKSQLRRVVGPAGGKGAWAAIDPIGGDIAAKMTASLRDDGELLVYSLMTVPTTNVGISMTSCSEASRWVAVATSSKHDICQDSQHPPCSCSSTWPVHDRLQGQFPHTRIWHDRRGRVLSCVAVAQVRGFWLGPWMRKESGDPQRVLRDTMALLADGTIVPEAGAQLTALPVAVCRPCGWHHASQGLMIHEALLLSCSATACLRYMLDKSAGFQIVLPLVCRSEVLHHGYR